MSGPTELNCLHDQFVEILFPLTREAIRFLLVGNGFCCRGSIACS